MTDIKGYPKTHERLSWKRKMVLTGVLAALVFSVFLASGRKDAAEVSVAETVPEEVRNASQSVIVNDAQVPGRVLAETSVVNPSLLQSENYRLGEVVVGGDIVIGVGDDSDQYLPLEISLVRGESLPGKSKNEARVLVTWKTSKSATSTLKYAKNTGESSKSLEESGYGVNHSAVLTGLDEASTYVYTLTVRDKWGNEIASDPYAVYTGAKDVSLFELISNALAETFGWAFKK